MNHISVIELIGQHEPGHRHQIETQIDIVLVAELVAEVVAEGVSVKGRSKLVQAVRNQLVGLIDRSLKAYLSSSELCGRLHCLSITRSTGSLLIMVTGWEIHTQPGHDHAPQRRQHVVLCIDEDISDSVIRETSEHTGTTVAVDIL